MYDIYWLKTFRGKLLLIPKFDNLQIQLTSVVSVPGLTETEDHWQWILIQHNKHQLWPTHKRLYNYSWVLSNGTAELTCQDVASLKLRRRRKSTAVSNHSCCFVEVGRVKESRAYTCNIKQSGGSVFSATRRFTWVTEGVWKHNNNNNNKLALSL